ncbi:MAG: hypothetical protein LBN12_02810 [Clostridiales Family XIII bacterium]|jgi:hypothetical protein|nr:hypothetical protein [Clostridiales Family XIII bacterium]
MMSVQRAIHNSLKRDVLLVVFSLALAVTLLGAGLYAADALQNEQALRLNEASSNSLPVSLPPAYHDQEFFATNLDYGITVARTGKPEVSAGNMYPVFQKHRAAAALKSSALAAARTENPGSSEPKDSYYIRC